MREVCEYVDLTEFDKGLDYGTCKLRDRKCFQFEKKMWCDIYFSERKSRVEKQED